MLECSIYILSISKLSSFCVHLFFVSVNRECRIVKVVYTVFLHANF